MSVWGKIIGAAAGLAIGGPIGALLGGIAGHFTLDRAIEEGQGPPDPDSPAAQLTFTMAVIALGAKMAGADGAVTRDEIAAFRRVFQVAPEDEPRVAMVFDLARRDIAGYEAYAEQVARIFQARPVVLEDLLDGLFVIAMADGVLAPKEEAFLASVAAIFGFSEEYFDRVRAAHLGPAQASPYTILGVERDVSAEELRRAYHRLVREHHPDRLIARGMPEEAVRVATEKLARINDAYDRITRERSGSGAVASG